MKTYETLCFDEKADFSKVPCGKIDLFNWEKGEDPFRPQSSFQMCFVKNKGIFLKMQSDEKNPRCENTARDSNIWEDSCLEFFFEPYMDGGYINLEMNPLGAYLLQIGKGREGRKFAKELSDLEPEITGKITENGWQISAFVSCELLSSLFKREFTACGGEYRGCFFKCGDKTAKPHYGSFVPMGELPPGFHNPQYFAKITVKGETK